MARRARTESRSVVVKRYANSRFYNTTVPGYVTPEELREMAGTGVDLIVYDAQTGENITPAFFTLPH